MEKAEKTGKEGVQLTIIEKIEALMDENKINQATLAREINIGPAQLSKCLNRKGNNYFGIDILIKVSDYFKVPVDQLLGRSSSKVSDNPRLITLFGMKRKRTRIRCSTFQIFSLSPI